MSKHKQKYPGLYERCKRARVGYQVMYMRCRAGMTVDEALALPVARPGRKPKIPRPLPEPVRTFLWERPEWTAKAPAIRRRRYTPRADDTSPDRIRRLRAAYCDKFIKTGVLDDGMAAQLRTYADEQRAAIKHSRRVPDEPVSQRYSGRSAGAGDDGRRDAQQIDGPTARRIADFLRSQ